MSDARAYLDWNASAPLCDAARAAMAAGMELAGNPSSIHAEGRAARGAVETARAQVAELAGCDPTQVIFTSGAAEAAALAAAQLPELSGGGVEHDCVFSHLTHVLEVDSAGRVVAEGAQGALTLQAANSETGVIQPPVRADLVDAVQALGKTDWRYDPMRMRFALISAHKIGGPKGAGALIAPAGAEIAPTIPGGGQELRRRAGTENLLGIIGFGAAAEAARDARAQGRWAALAEARDALQRRLEQAGARIIGAGAARLPNTLCLVARGWESQMQVMSMDLAGFAVSAGSACSSGKIAASRTLTAMGLSAAEARCALRISFGPGTSREALERFAAIWTEHYATRRQQAA